MDLKDSWMCGVKHLFFAFLPKAYFKLKNNTQRPAGEPNNKGRWLCRCMTIGMLLHWQSSHEWGEKDRLPQKQVKAKRVITGFAVTVYARVATLGDIYLPLQICFFGISERMTNAIFPVMDRGVLRNGARANPNCGLKTLKFYRFSNTFSKLPSEILLAQ